MNRKITRRFYGVLGTYQLAPSTIIMQYGRMLRSVTHRVPLISGEGRRVRCSRVHENMAATRPPGYVSRTKYYSSKLYVQNTSQRCRLHFCHVKGMCRIHYHNTGHRYQHLAVWKHTSMYSAPGPTKCCNPCHRST